MVSDQRQFDYSIGALDGRAELYPKVKGRDGLLRAGINDRFQIIFVLQEKVRGKWYRRMVEENGLESDQEGSTKEEECEFVATFQGGAKARIRHRFERKKIIISTEVVQKASDVPTRAGVLIVTPIVHGVLQHQKVPSEDEMEEIMEDDEVRVLRADGESSKFNLNEKVTLSDPELMGDGFEEYSIEVKKYGGKPMIISSATKGAGSLLLEQKKRLFESYRMYWYPAENKTASQGAELVIEFK